MDLRQLKTFRMVATTLSFSRAAVALDYAQSTITAQIQGLEGELGVPLFNRLGRRVELTEAGLRLLAYSERLLDLEEETRLVVTGQQALSGTLTIGAPETVCTYRLPQVLRCYREEVPNVRLIFRPLPYAELLRSVRNGTVDVAFLLEQPIQASNLIVETLTREPLVVVATAGHPLAHQQTVNPRELEGEPLLLTERGCGYRSSFERALATEGVVAATNMEFDSVEAIKQCVIANVGVAILPLVAVEEEVREGKLSIVPWSEPDFVVYTQMIWHRDKWVSPAMAAFIRISREMLLESSYIDTLMTEKV
ncbi:MAG: LysR family transcriptional regulator [Chloroflexi bacterium]|nr:LysR family transcriptional regulator [Chloroflexota bacterium]MCI0577033.1 LysR family transcriptional regulator [Chloroflexota bacterium]MCI0648811.1 LysR family transcriptional regulator [Chloroflexota bacterium]MCI0726313.1 LysR family transcriptional regulator [Chloroflexota bacterium]